jgi:hypothetical protein
VLLVCRGLLDGAFPTDRAVVYTFGLVLPKAHIPSVPKLQVQLRILEMRQLLQEARSKVDAAAATATAAEQQRQADAGAVADIDKEKILEKMVRELEANTRRKDDKPGIPGGISGAAASPAVAAVAGRRTVTARRSARLAGK